MRWPQADEYQAAVQNPGFNFTDPDLKASKVAINKLGLPRVASGNFASVYEMQKGAQRWAVRCFLHPPKPDQQLRYDLLSRHLANLSLPSLVEFEYQPQGILVGGTRYPIVKMEWVEGELLTTYLEKRRQEP